MTAGERAMSHAAQCSIDDLVTLQKTALGFALQGAQRARDLVLILDQIGDYRFGRDWTEVSPAQIHDRLRVRVRPPARGE